MSVLATPRSRVPMLSPASAKSSSLRNISMPVTTVFFFVGQASDLDFSFILMVPRSTAGSATVLATCQ